MRFRPSDQPAARRRELAQARAFAGDWPVAPPRKRRVSVHGLRQDGDAVAAVRAAWTMAEFVRHQLGLLGARRTERGRGPRGQSAVESGLWLDDHHWLAWTTCGELVSIEAIEPGSMRGSPEVRRLADHELPAVFAAGKLIPTVVALYRGDRLDLGPVWRYITHHDLRGALDAALGRARASEARVPAAPTSPSVTPLAGPRAGRGPKTRHHPLGNFILYRQPRGDEALPGYAAVLQLPPVPEAFPDRRSATRFLSRMERLGLDPAGAVVARVLGCVEVQPVWRPGIRVPSDPGSIIEMLRNEPRAALPELRAAWLPRFEQGEDGDWREQVVKKRGTVRRRWSRQLLHQVAEEGARFAALLEDNTIRQRTGTEPLAVADRLSRTLRLVQQAERRLPAAWLGQLGIWRESPGPDWQKLAAAPRVDDVGHWLRAPSEYGRPHVDGQRRRLVELEVGDLAGLLEVAGLRPRFLLVKHSTSAIPEWRCVVEAAASYEP
jgi:hypothetical protein